MARGWLRKYRVGAKHRREPERDLFFEPVGKWPAERGFEHQSGESTDVLLARTADWGFVGL